MEQFHAMSAVDVLTNLRTCRWKEISHQNFYLPLLILMPLQLLTQYVGNFLICR